MGIQLLKKIEQLKGEMFLAERKVADYISANPHEAVELNVSDLAEKSGTSDATVIRVCKRLGYKGFYQMKLALAEELGRYQLTGYTGSADKPETAGAVIRWLIRDLLFISERIDDGKAEKIAEMICAAERVFVIAEGNTIPVAMDFAFRLCRVGINANCETIIEYGIANMVDCSSRDLMIAVSHSGSSRHVLQAAEIAAKRGMPVAAVTGSAKNPLAKKAGLSLLTAVETPLFGEYGAATHIYDQAVLDAVLYLVCRKQKLEDGIELIETLLAEYKI